MSQLRTTGCQAINNIFFPEICSSCGEVNEGFLCGKCRDDIIEIKKISCNFCGAPLIQDNKKSPVINSCNNLLPAKLFSKKQNPEINFESDKISTAENNTGCAACRECGYSFYILRSFGIYSGVLKKLIIKFKYNKIYTLAPVLNSFLKKSYIENLINEKIDYMDTVPDHNSFKNGLSYPAGQPDNHMQVLAKMFSRETGIPYESNIIKLKKTLKQQNLGMYERKVNLEGVFKAADMLKVFKKNILIIDDVWTTGNTLNEISKALKKCGAQKIYLLTIARAI